MKKTEVMKTLKSLGSEQTAKTYARHGAQPPMFGVKYADLYKLQKQIKCDHALAMQLWETGNHDARTLATLIVDASQMKASDLDTWVKSATSQVTCFAVMTVAIKTPHAHGRAKKWMKSKNQWIAATGWEVIAGLAGLDDSLDDATFAAYIDEIKTKIHDAPNRVRHSMNQSLISIGCRNASLQKQAIAAAKVIGKVDVDHGDTSCKTPDAAAYIKKVVAHRSKKKTGTKKTTAKKVTKKTAKKKSTTKKKTATKKKSTKKKTAKASR